MTEDERTDAQQGMEDVEAHGAKEIAGVGLAAAALIGAGAAGVKMATDDDKSRNQAALVDRSLAERLAMADADKDGYVTYGELAHEGFKWTTEELRSEVDVSAEGLAAAGYKMELGLIGSDDGFPLKEDLILLKWGSDPALDELAKGGAGEWTKKIREIDQDTDGYAASEELEKAGYKWDTRELSEAAQKEITAEELAKAGWKQPVHTFGEGGFAMEEDMVLLKYGIDSRLDALIKGETEG